MLKDPQPVDNSQQTKDQLALASIMGILDAWRSTAMPIGYIHSFQVLAKIRELVGGEPTPANKFNQPALHIAIPKELNLTTAKALLDFANALAEKLRKNELKYGYGDGWLTEDWQGEFHKELTHHLGKGDARDVAIYAMFAWVRGWQTRLELSAIPEWVEVSTAYESQAARNLELVEQANKGAETIKTLEGIISKLESEVSDLRQELKATKSKRGLR